MNELNITIIASGPRYGSSLVASIFDACGAYGGEGVYDSGPANPQGFYENEAIKTLCVIPYINRFLPGKIGDKNRTKAIDARNYKTPFVQDQYYYQPPFFRDRVLDILRIQGWDGVQPLYYKMPLATLMCSVWHKAFPEAKWVTISRPWKEVRTALINQGWMTPIPDGKEETHGYDKISMYEKALAALQDQPDVDWVGIDAGRIFNHDYDQLKSAIERSGLVFDFAAVEERVCATFFE